MKSFACRGNFDERSVLLLETLSECIVKILGENTDVTTVKKGELLQDKNATHRICFRSIQYKKVFIKKKMFG